MRSLTFGYAGTRDGGRRVREAQFQERSGLPASAACLVAGGARETLAALLGAPVSMRLLEPAIPAPDAWPEIVRGALLYRVRGSLLDAAIVLRPTDALAIACAAFGEAVSGSPAAREPSALERDVLERAVAAIAGSLSAVCGAGERGQVERVGTIGGFVTYFELAIERPFQARVGIALSRDPSPEPHGALTLDELGAVRLEPRVTLELAGVEAAAVARLAPGAIVPITRSSAFRGSLRLGGRTLARGTCGVKGGRYAFAVDSSA
jgi:hypothetical protein